MQKYADGILLAILVAGFWGWAQALRRRLAGRRVLDHVPREPVPWGLLDVLFALVSLVLFQVLGFLIVRRLYQIGPELDFESLPPHARAATICATSLASLLTAAVSLVAVRLRAEATGEDFGFVHRRVGLDVGLGVLAFAMLAPPVYGLQWLLTQWFPSQHPLITLLRDHREPHILLIVIFAAVIVAPVVEEYFFRVLLQGWLERALSTGESPHELIFAAGDSRGRADAGPQPPSQPRWLPIVASSLLFAWMHASHGPDPIPLFFFAFGLGYLYQRTHRILPSMTVHFLLNAGTLTGLLLTL